MTAVSSFYTDSLHTLSRLCAVIVHHISSLGWWGDAWAAADPRNLSKLQASDLNLELNKRLPVGINTALGMGSPNK